MYIQQCFRYCSKCWTTCSELTKVLDPMELIFFFFFFLKLVIVNYLYFFLFLLFDKNHYNVVK